MELQIAGWMIKVGIDWAANNVNVIAVDWEELALELLNYFVVSEINTKLVAPYIVTLIEILESKGANVSETTMAGHSIGAQIAGLVGLALKKKSKTLKKIYGMIHYHFLSFM